MQNPADITEALNAAREHALALQASLSVASDLIEQQDGVTHKRLWPLMDGAGAIADAIDDSETAQQSAEEVVAALLPGRWQAMAGLNEANISTSFAGGRLLRLVRSVLVIAEMDDGLRGALAKAADEFEHCDAVDDGGNAVLEAA